MKSSFINATDYYTIYGHLSKRRKFEKPSDEQRQSYVKNSVPANTQNNGGYDLFIVLDKTYQGGYFHHRRAHEKAQDQSHITPPDEPNEIGPIAGINH
ncbi:hypothetical protein F8M41_007986 [Gigaspora margarita]|uniref:Uncharacterized protein n=1 Tax=Gigaspora margarita TaxID=4874 RepID=A0A8H3X489_GIGMA|nr:hypothetical protein F8M41_007986 [Gigaspora margarita]